MTNTIKEVTIGATTTNPDTNLDMLRPNSAHVIVVGDAAVNLVRKTWRDTTFNALLEERRIKYFAGSEGLTNFFDSIFSLENKVNLHGLILIVSIRVDHEYKILQHKFEELVLQMPTEMPFPEFRILILKTASGKLSGRQDILSTIPKSDGLKFLTSLPGNHKYNFAEIVYNNVAVDRNDRERNEENPRDIIAGFFTTVLERKYAGLST